MRSDLVYIDVEINPLQVVQQAAVEERPDFEDPVRFVIRTWPWPDQPEGLPQVQELIRNPLLMYIYSDDAEYRRIIAIYQIDFYPGTALVQQT